MEITTRLHRKRLEEVRKQRHRDIAHIWRVPFDQHYRIRTTRQVHCHVRKSLIHWCKTIAHADNTLAVAQRLVKGLTQCQRHILHCVMDINMQIALRFDSQVKETMHGKVRQHVVKESHTCGNLVFACSIQIQFDLDLCFVCLTGYF